MLASVRLALTAMVAFLYFPAHSAQARDEPACPNPPGFTLEAEALASALAAHTVWVGNAKQGQRAVLCRLEAPGASFKDRDLRGIDLRLSRLEQADFSNTRLDGSAFEYADLTGAKLPKTSLHKVSFYRANLRDTDFTGARGAKVKLRETNLQGANFSAASLPGADLGKSSAVQTRFVGTNLRGAELGNAVLENATFAGAKLDKANLRGAVLTGTQLTGASMHAADVEGATFNQTSLDDVDRTGLVGYAEPEKPAASTPALPASRVGEATASAQTVVASVPSMPTADSAAEVTVGNAEGNANGNVGPSASGDVAKMPLTQANPSKVEPSGAQVGAGDALTTPGSVASAVNSVVREKPVVTAANAAEAQPQSGQSEAPGSKTVGASTPDARGQAAGAQSVVTSTAPSRSGAGQPAAPASPPDSGQKRTAMAGTTGMAQSSATVLASTSSAPDGSRTMASAESQPSTSPLARSEDRPLRLYRVQFGSYRNETFALESTERLRRRHASRLGSVQVVLERTNYGSKRGVWHQVRTEPMPERRQASRLCAALKAHDDSLECIVVRSSSRAGGQ